MKPTHGFEGVSPALQQRWRATRPVLPNLPDPGPEFLTARQIAKIWGVSIGRTAERLRELGQKVEKAHRYIRTVTGAGRKIPVYRLKEST